MVLEYLNQEAFLRRTPVIYKLFKTVFNQDDPESQEYRMRLTEVFEELKVYKSNSIINYN